MPNETKREEIRSDVAEDRRWLEQGQPKHPTPPVRDYELEIEIVVKSTVKLTGTYLQVCGLRNQAALAAGGKIQSALGPSFAVVVRPIKEVY